MAFKINVAHKGKTFKLESSAESLVGLSIGEKVEGKELDEKLDGFELEITGTSDKSGFAGSIKVDGPNQKKVLLDYGHGMKKKPKGETKINRKPKGLRLRKTLRGKEISTETVQINTKVIKEGKTKFEALFDVPTETKEEKKE